MIEQSVVKKLVEERLDKNMFLVDIAINDRNVIQVIVDSYDGLTIDQCVSISRNVEHNLDREAEDFELQVSSPGLTEGFRIREQYLKYKGKLVEVDTGKGSKLEGILSEVDEDNFALEVQEREMIEGKRKKQLVKRNYKFGYDEIKSTKAVISFKKNK